MAVLLFVLRNRRLLWHPFILKSLLITIKQDDCSVSIHCPNQTLSCLNKALLLTDWDLAIMAVWSLTITLAIKLNILKYMYVYCLFCRTVSALNLFYVGFSSSYSNHSISFQKLSYLFMLLHVYGGCWLEHVYPLSCHTSTLSENVLRCVFCLHASCSMLVMALSHQCTI